MRAAILGRRAYAGGALPAPRPLAPMPLHGFAEMEMATVGVAEIGEQR